jgi:hypothetical protein
MHRLAWILIPTSAVVAACADDSMTPMSTLRLDLERLPDPGDDAVYEGWAIVDGEPVSTGRFGVGAGGTSSPDTFEVALAPDEIARIVITVEPATGDAPEPSPSRLLAGDVSGGEAALTTTDAGALATDFAAAAGSFVLATPSTGDTMDDNAQGIWWLVPGMPPAPSLELPALPEGWVYEGWVASADGPITTGRFDAPDAADLDGAGPTAGPDPAPPFPGQDYIDPPLVLNAGDVRAVITVEPEPDPAAAPFPLRPLVTDPIAAATAPTAQSMTNVAAESVPEGAATLE